MAKNFSPAVRAEYSLEAYRLSLDGMSNAEIAAHFGTTRQTVKHWIDLVADRRRDELRIDRTQQYAADCALSVYREARHMMRVNQSRSQPSMVGHAQNANAALAALDRWVALRGAEPPKRTQAEVLHHRAKEQERLLDENLGEEERWVWMLLADKARGTIPRDVPLLDLIERHRRSGTLTGLWDTDIEARMRILEAAPEEIVEDPELLDAASKRASILDAAPED